MPASQRVKIRFQRLPGALKKESRCLARCIRAFNRVKLLQEVYLFGSFARGDSRRGSDVDLCLVAHGAEKQLKTAAMFRRAIREIRPKPSLTLLPITPERLAEKQAKGDPFFATVLNEGILLATKD